MVSHKHKFIFIHIPKCAGSSVEAAFGIDVNNNTGNREFLFGWDDENKIYLQHATPQQLLDFNLLTKEQWHGYYKLIIVRNTWDKVMSDYFWFRETKNFTGTFEDYLYGINSFKKFMKEGSKSYRGDHLSPQKEYMFLDGSKIKYNRFIYFDKLNLTGDLKGVIKDMKLSDNFFDRKVQVGKKIIQNSTIRVKRKKFINTTKRT
jgi:hypothetical protein